MDDADIAKKLERLHYTWNDDEPKTHDLPTTPQPEAAPPPKNNGWDGQRYNDWWIFEDCFMDKSKTSDAEKCVWICIWNRTNAKTRLATVSSATIAKKSGYDRRTITRAIKSLQKKGFIQVVKHGGWGVSHTANTYRLVFDIVGEK